MASCIILRYIKSCSDFIAGELWSDLMSNLFLLFNHEITSLQEKDARESLCVERIIDLPPDLKALWRRISPDLEEIGACLKPVKDWLSRHAAR